MKHETSNIVIPTEWRDLLSAANGRILNWAGMTDE